MANQSTSSSKYRLIGLAIAAVVANVGFAMARDPSFGVRQALLLAGLCIVATFVVGQAVSALETIVARRSGSGN